ncbi:hypothetical protein FT637_25035 [Bacillus cereus]|uniref:hypothetical protein n=1 Tax=Bacillus cereus TaxID=1396 RepID=UPI00187A24FE|nr:hypothetical protein [Bacillus cereus]MBE7106154.1 hypothetical protein [Bacillus cereus]
MKWDNYNNYINALVDVMRKPVRNARGYLVVGDLKTCTSILQDIKIGLEKEGIMTHYLNFNTCADEDNCIDILKKARKELKKHKNEIKRILVMESFDRLDQRVMDAVKILIGCQAVGIEIVVSAAHPMVHMVGLTRYMVKMNPSDEMYSELYRYDKEQTVFGLRNEGQERVELHDSD